MDNEIVNDKNIDILKRMINSRFCPKCGGQIMTFKTGICPICGTKWETNYLNTDFEFIISKLDNYSFELNEFTIYLYSLKDYNEELDKKLKTFNVDENIKNRLNIINGKLFNGIKLSDEENSLLRYSLFCDIAPSSELNVMAVINNILRNNMIVNYDAFKGIIVFFIKFLIKNAYSNMINGYTPIVNITNFDDDLRNSTGIAHDIFKISINEDIINDLYNNKNLEAFITIFHELVHIEQNIYIKFGYISDSIMDYIKDDVIVRIIKDDNGIDYYKENYDHISFENDAEIIGTITAMKWLENAGIKLTDNFKVFLNNSVNREVKKRSIRTRTVNGKEYDIDELFESCIKLHPEYIDKYPQLGIQYFVDGKYVFERNSAQLNELLKYYERDDIVKTYIYELINNIENKETKKITK